MIDFNGSYDTNNVEKSPNRLSQFLIFGSGYRRFSCVLIQLGLDEVGERWSQKLKKGKEGGQKDQPTR